MQNQREHKLNSFKDFVKRIIEAHQPKETRDYAISALLKMLGDKMNLEKVLNVSPDADNAFHYLHSLIGVECDAIYGDVAMVESGKINEPIETELARDMTKLLNYMYFDGTHYRRISDNAILCEAKSFDFGCMFELGRIMIENEISFVEYKARLSAR